VPAGADATLKIAGNDVGVSSVSGRIAMNELFSIQAVGTSSSEHFIGQKFALTVGDVCHVHGIVSRVETENRQGDRHVTLELSPEVFALSIGEASEVFQQLSVPDIVKRVLETAGIAASATKWQLSATHAVREYCVQRAESDWAFITRLLAEEGISYFFALGKDSTVLTFDDDMTSTDSSGKIDYRTSFGVTPPAGEKWLAGLQARDEITHDATLVRDRNYEKPALALEGKSGSGTKHRFYEWPGRFDAPGDGTTRAKTLLESLTSTSKTRSGASGDGSIACGNAFEIDKHPNDARNEKLLCIEQSFTADGSSQHAAFTWKAVPAATKFRPSFKNAARPPLGPEPATITGAASKEVDVDASARVVFQPLWDRLGKNDDKASMRTRTSQVFLAESTAIPRVGFSMLVAHHDGDLERPFTYARHTDGTHPSPYKQPDMMTRSAWQTLTSASDGTSTELRFEDKADAEEIYWNAAKDMTVTIGDNDAWTIGNSDSLEVGGKRAVTIGADDKLTVTSDQTIDVKGKETITYEGKRSLTVKGGETTKVDGDRKLEAGDDAVRDVKGALTMKVLDAMTLKTKGGLTREVLKKQVEKSGGAWKTQTDAGLAVIVSGDGKESVTGARTETGKKGVETLVGGDMKETISAGLTVTAQGGFGESAKGKLEMKASAAVSATGQTIEIEGKSEITIVCGGSTITLKSSGVEVKSATVTCTGPIIVNDGAQVKHNP
jgi:type VI secretion system secreted protein VgrG